MEHHSNIVPWQLPGRAHGRQARLPAITGAIGLLDLSLIIAVTFALVAHTVIRPAQSLSAEFLVQPEVSLWQPWVFYWQVLVLTFAVWIASASTPPTDGHPPRPSGSELGRGQTLSADRQIARHQRLGGLALWLVFTFIQSIAASISKPWLDFG